MLLSSPKFTNFVTIIDKNNWDSLYFHKKVQTCLKLHKILPPPWLNVVPSLKKPCQAVEIRNEQANLQPTLNKGGGGGASLTIFVTGISLHPFIQLMLRLKFSTDWEKWFPSDSIFFGVGITCHNCHKLCLQMNMTIIFGTSQNNVWLVYIFGIFFQLVL